MSDLQWIGRRAQLGEIQQQLYHVLSGQPRVWLVEGLAGIGKTRFLEEVRAMAEQQGMDVYTGSCDEMLTAPYAPFATLLTRLEDELGTGYQETARLHPLFGASRPARSMPPLDDVKQDQLQLQIAVSRGLIQPTEVQPLLVTLDNIHAADQPSLELFAYLTFALAHQRAVPIWLVASHRPVASHTIVGRLLHRLQQVDIVRKLELSELEAPETRELLQHLGVRRPTQQLVDIIHRATHGIPLFIQEAVHHARRTGALYRRRGYLAVRQQAIATWQLSQDIADAITGRIDMLPVACRVFLTRASLLGDTFSTERLTAIGLAPRTTDMALKTAMEYGVLRREHDRYQFAHTLVRQALTARLSLEARQRLHLHIAQAMAHLDEVQPGTHMLEIAHHLHEARPLVDASTLIRYTSQAGHQAFSRSAWREAARYYEAALSAMATGSNRAALHQQAGLSHYRNQDVGPALEHFEQAAAAYATSGDRPGLAHSLMWLVRLHLMHAAVPMGTLPPYVEDLEALLETVGDEASQLRGHILAVLAQAYRAARQPEKAAELAQNALVMGRLARDDQLCSQAEQARGLTCLGRLQVEAAIESWQAALHFARTAHDVTLEMLALNSLPLALTLKGDLEQGEAMALEGLNLSQTLQDWGERSKALSHLATTAVVRGNFVATEQYARDAVEMVERSRYPWGGFRALCAMACAAAARGLWQQANQCLDHLVEPGRVFEAPGRIIEVFTRVFRQLILGYDAKRMTEDIVSLHDDLMQAVTHDTHSLAPLCAMIELGQITLKPALTERPAQMLAVAMERGVLFSSGWGFLIPRSLGVAAKMQEEWQQAEVHFQHAMATAAYVGAVPELARTYLDNAHLICLSPHTENDAPAINLFEQAKVMFHERNMLPHARLAQHFLDHLFGPSADADDPDTYQSQREPPPPFRNGTTAPE